MRQQSRGFLVVLLIILLCGCGTTVECIDPDDWGGDFKVTVSSTSADVQPVNPADPEGDQYIPWTQGFQLTGKPVVMVVDNAANLTYPINCSDPSNFNSATSSWRFIYANPSLVNSPFVCTDSGCSTLPLCTFNPVTAPSLPWFPPGYSMATDSLPDTNTPCVLAMGIGLYSVITKNSVAPDGKSLGCDSSMSDQTNCLLHVGDGACTGSSIVGCTTPFISQGCNAGGAAFVPPTDCQTETCTIYFKILDTYYADNFGSYNVRFKQGVQNESSPGVITTFVAMAQGILCSATEDIFKNIIDPNEEGGENPYLMYIRVLLTLYIMFVGIGYLTGFVDFTHQELIVRIFKIALVIQLTTTSSSWHFFYNYFFKFFTNGVGELTGIIFGDAITATKVSIPGIPMTSSCAFQNLSGFASFDQAFRELLSYETSRKIFTLLTWKGGGYVGGALLVVIFYILIGLVLFIILKSILIYVVCYLAISMLIVLSPIFIPFILFKVTRHWFDSWLKNLISYFIQPIIILTFAFFMLQIFMSQLQYLFGYRVCFKHWFTFISSSVLDIRVFAWQTDFQSNPEKVCMLTPNAIVTASSSGNEKITVSKNAMGQATYSLATYPGPNCTLNYGYYNKTPNSSNLEYCEPYACSQERYADYPYLNPDIPSDSNRITELQNDELVSLKDLGIFVLIVWFMMQFNEIVPSIARKIGGTPQSFADLASAGNAMGGGLAKWAGKAGVAAANPLYRKAFGKNRDLGMDMKLAAKRINTLRDAAVNKAAEVKNSAVSAVDEKLSKSPVGGLYKAAKFAKGAVDLEGTLSKGVEAVGQKTTGKLLQQKDKAEDLVKGFGEHVSEKAGNALMSAKDRAQQAVSDFRQDPAGSLKAMKNKAAGGLSSAKDAVAARLGIKGTPMAGPGTSTGGSSGTPTAGPGTSTGGSSGTPTAGSGPSTRGSGTPMAGPGTSTGGSSGTPMAGSRTSTGGSGPLDEDQALGGPTPTAGPVSSTGGPTAKLGARDPKAPPPPLYDPTDNPSRGSTAGKPAGKPDASSSGGKPSSTGGKPGGSSSGGKPGGSGTTKR